MALPTDTKQIGVTPRRNDWVQTERSAHEAWAKLAIESPRASALMHLLVAKMGQQNAVVISQKLLAQLMGCHERTVRRAAAELAASQWIQIVQVGAAGSVNAYVVNAGVAWGAKRSSINNIAVFNAAIIASAEEQPEGVALEAPPKLRQIPVLFTHERQLPSGEGAPPPSQPALEGLEPDLPSLRGEEQLDLLD
jgi:hypothetical protein